MSNANIDSHTLSSSSSMALRMSGTPLSACSPAPGVGPLRALGDRIRRGAGAPGWHENCLKEYSSITSLALLRFLRNRSQEARSMKIAQVAPLFESVPPQGYGGTERVVSYLTEELVRQGHQVTLFASGDSVTQAHLVAACPRALRLDEQCVDQLAHGMVLLEHVFRQAPTFDLLHFHIDYLHFPLSVRQRVPHVTTLHGRLDIPDLVPVYQTFP